MLDFDESPSPLAHTAANPWQQPTEAASFGIEEPPPRGATVSRRADLHTRRERTAAKAAAASGRGRAVVQQQQRQLVYYIEQSIHGISTTAEGGPPATPKEEEELGRGGGGGLYHHHSRDRSTSGTKKKEKEKEEKQRSRSRSASPTSASQRRRLLAADTRSGRVMYAALVTNVAPQMGPCDLPPAVGLLRVALGHLRSVGRLPFVTELLFTKDKAIAAVCPRVLLSSPAVEASAEAVAAAEALSGATMAAAATAPVLLVSIYPVIAAREAAESNRAEGDGTNEPLSFPDVTTVDGQPLRDVDVVVAFVPLGPAAGASASANPWEPSYLEDCLYQVTTGRLSTLSDGGGGHGPAAAAPSQSEAVFREAMVDAEMRSQQRYAAAIWSAGDDDDAHVQRRRHSISREARAAVADGFTGAEEGVEEELAPVQRYAPFDFTLGSIRRQRAAKTAAPRRAMFEFGGSSPQRSRGGPFSTISTTATSSAGGCGGCGSQQDTSAVVNALRPLKWGRFANDLANVLGMTVRRLTYLVNRGEGVAVGVGGKEGLALPPQ